MPSLLVTHGHHFGVRYELLPQTSVGRSSSCTVQLLDEKVSRLHSTIFRDGERWMVRDEGSSNGTGHNGRLILEPTALQPGDELAIGNNLLLYEPALDILRDLEGAGAVVLAPAAAATHGAASPPQGRLEPFRVEALLGAVAEMLAGPRGLGRPSSLVEAVVRGLGADRGALLLTATGGEPMKAVATFPHRGRVAVLRGLIDKAVERRAPVLSGEGTVDLVVKSGRSFVEGRAGACLAVPLFRGGRLKAAFVADASAPDAFLGIPLDAVAHAVALAFSSVLGPDPTALRAPRSEDAPPLPVAESPSMARVLELARSFAEQNGPILLHAEPGAGARTVSRFIHDQGPRAQGPFFCVDCAALPEQNAEALLFGAERAGGNERPTVGSLESVDGGTLVLLGVEELPAALQVKVLRLLQEGRFYRVGGTRPVRIDARVLAATNRDLQALARDGVFRQDLWERFQVARIDVPPLRKRLADIEPLVRRTLQAWNDRNGQRIRSFSADAIGLLETYEWPGNVTELEDLVQRVLVLCQHDDVGPADVQTELNARPSVVARDPQGAGRDALTRQDRALLARALQRSRGHRDRAAALLGWDRAELERRTVEAGLDAYGR